MRKLIKLTAATLALILSAACYIVPVERVPRRRTVEVYDSDSYYYDDYCLDPPGRAVECDDVYDGYSQYVGTCCEMYQPGLEYDYCRPGHGVDDQLYFETWCQWIDSCEWEYTDAFCW